MCVVPEHVQVAPVMYGAQSAYLHEVAIVRGLTLPLGAGDTLAEGPSLVAPVPSQNCICDSGAGPSVLTTEFIYNLPSDVSMRRVSAKQMVIRGADGKALQVAGIVRVLFTVCGYPYEHTFRVLRGPPVLILGNDFLAPLHASIHPRTYTDGGGYLRLPHACASGGWLEAPLSIERGRLADKDLLRMDASTQPVTVVVVMAAWDRRGLVVDVRNTAGGEKELQLLQKTGHAAPAELLRTILENDVGIVGEADDVSGQPTWLHRVKQLLVATDPTEGEVEDGATENEDSRVLVYACMLDDIEGYAAGRVVPRAMDGGFVPTRGTTWRPLLRVVKSVAAQGHETLARLVWLATVRAAGLRSAPPELKKASKTVKSVKEQVVDGGKVLALSTNEKSSHGEVNQWFTAEGQPLHSLPGQRILYAETPIRVAARSEKEEWLTLPRAFSGKAGPFLVTPLAARSGLTCLRRGMSSN